MKKLLTILFALSIGLSTTVLGTTYTFNKTATGTYSWAVNTNWTPNGVPGNGDAVVIPMNSTTGTITINNVPTVSLTNLNITNGTNSRTLRFVGVNDQETLTITYNGSNTSDVTVASKVTWNCGFDATKRVNVVMAPKSRFKIEATITAGTEGKFVPAVYTDCEEGIGFILQADASGHAELIQQNTCSTAILGQQEYYWPNSMLNDYHYISVPISTSIFSGDPNVGTGDVCRKANCLCFLSGNNVRPWDYTGQVWGSWMTNYTDCYHADLDLVAGDAFEFYARNNSASIYGNFLVSSAAWPLLDGSYTLANNWYLLGNPFPSGVAFNGNAGSGIIGWDWTYNLVSPWVCYWNATYDTYFYYMWYNGGGSSPIAIPSDLGQNPTPNIIPRSQGFFVYALVDNATVGVANQAREFATSETIGKSAQTNESRNQLYLTLSGAAGNQDWEVVQFTEDGAANMTPFDIVKFDESNATKSFIYTKKDNNKLVASTLALNNENVAVPLYLTVGTTGTYTLTADKLASFGNTAGVILKDNKTNTTIDLKETPSYTFTAEANEDNGRFMLFFSNVLGVSNPTLTDVKVYSANQSIFIQNSGAANGTVTVYDMIGKEVLNTNLTSQNLMQVNTNLTKGFYIVTVKTSKGQLTQKVFIN